MATLESLRGKSEYRTKLKINAVRLPNMKISVNFVPISQRWTFIQNSDTIKTELTEEVQSTPSDRVQE